MCVYMHVYVQVCRWELYYIHSCRGKVGWEREHFGHITTHKYSKHGESDDNPHRF